MKQKFPLIFIVLSVCGIFVWKIASPTASDIPGLSPKKSSKIRLNENLNDEDLKIAALGFRQNHDLPTDSQAMIKLGSKFFFDKNFSANGEVNCAKCHDPSRSFTDGNQTSTGISLTAMNAPTLINSYAGTWFFWNGRADSLEAQSLGPVENPKEHGFSRSKVLARIAEAYRLEYEAVFGKLPQISAELSSLPPPAQKHSKVSSAVAAYALGTLGSDQLQKTILRNAQTLGVQPVEVLKTMSAMIDEPPTAFDKIPSKDQDEINQVFANFGRAVAAFERTIRTADAPFDLFVDRLQKVSKPESALSEDFTANALRGFRLFTGRANCALCHHGPNFTDNQFHNIGMMAISSETLDLGRAQGMLDARDNIFNCKGPYLKQKTDSDACQELDYIETESAEAVGAFKTPTLRNLAQTAPYGHDGRFPNLDSILQHYNHLAVPPAVGRVEETLVPLKLSENEIRDLETFLLSLGSPVNFFREE